MDLVNVEYCVYVWCPSTFLDAGRVYHWEGYKTQDVAEADALEAADQSPNYIVTITKVTRTEEALQ